MTVRVSDCRHGQQIYFDNDRYFAPMLEQLGEYVPGEAALFAQVLKPGDTAVDVGANIGCHSVAMGRLVGPEGCVVAFEPQYPMFCALCGTVALNELWQVHAYPVALGEGEGTARIANVRDYGAPGVNLGGVSLYTDDPGPEVRVQPLDAFCLDRCSLIKIDVEGFETEVLLGARQTIAAHRPVLYVEADRKQHNERLIGVLRDMDYRLFLHTPRLYNPDNWRGYGENPFPGWPDLVAIMLVGLPAEREFVVQGESLEISCAGDMPDIGRAEV